MLWRRVSLSPSFFLLVTPLKTTSERQFYKVATHLKNDIVEQSATIDSQQIQPLAIPNFLTLVGRTKTRLTLCFL